MSSFLFLLLCTGIGAIWSANIPPLSKKVLMISMDGFRWDYLDMVPETPHIKQMAGNGVQLKYVNNTFITKTFPTHYAIATGLWEETHGIVGNSMYDPLFNETFRMGNTETKWWNEGEPIWITAKKQNLKTGTYFWPGSEVKIQGMYPDIWKRYNGSVPFRDRVDTVVDWFQNGHVDLATLYFNEPDHTGHLFGPFSDEIKAKVREMDSLLGYLINKLNEAGVLSSLNIILTSDHGMTEVNKTTRIIYLDAYVNPDDIYLIPESGPVANILPKPGRENIVYNDLRGKHSKMTVYRKEDIPEHFHYKNNRRVMPIVAIAADGWMIEYNSSSMGKWDPRGNHGYDNRLLDMRPIFVAQGPNFKDNYKTNSINSVDIYPMLCALLGIQPAPHNGTLDNSAEFLDIPGLVSGGSQKGEITLMALVMAIIRHLSG
ncbi:hypothetical protein LOTGIDRAFT_214482 [Lottia gigantea]|uniref:AP3A hydrolase n=1 Tax=Lottia gigantea TaxID=225164 RepID=V3ZZH7_LOTGI|nr:hypothetical protein LOTGIDRAFT_214482 [Lottia gigantea]ESO96943.1 hypothetical protein LOTGIDRAFT_214482 [Lottia gigantea]